MPTLCWRRSGGCTGTGAARRSYPTSTVRSGGCEELPHVQGKQQWLRFAGAAVKRYPMFTVRSGGCEEIPHVQGKRNPSKMVGTERGHQRADRLKP